MLLTRLEVLSKPNYTNIVLNNKLVKKQNFIAFKQLCCQVVYPVSLSKTIFGFRASFFGLRISLRGVVGDFWL